ncbi:aldo/keto reductase [Novosphingobium sp. RD2P27]|uniref:Aldo/keto reductase n=1 Tax=Novosphingobium kalidii TaxID=3230299 RepID=A0ABV2D2D2_9SPHN
MGIEKGGTFAIGGETRVHRLGFGAMRLTGPNVWGEATDAGNPQRLLHRARELGINLIDTAEAYGPHVNERQIREALAPYPDDLLIATKCGLLRTWPEGAKYPLATPDGRPSSLRASTEGSLRRLGVERIDLQQLHRVDPQVPVEESVGALAELKAAGKIAHIGLSEVDVEQLARAKAITPIATVQNKFNVADREHEAVLRYCEEHDIGFMPWYPIGGGKAQSGAVVASLADRYRVLPAQIALAWLLKRSPNMLLIPGTASVAHLEENVGACDVDLNDEDMRELDGAA